MPDSPGQLVLNRLASVSAFHPSVTETFSDWRIQAGDIVSVVTDERTYTTPVYGMTLKWTGKPKVSLEATGNQVREELPAMQRKAYATGARGYANQQAIAGVAGDVSLAVGSISALEGQFQNLITGNATATTLKANAMVTETINIRGLWVWNGSAYVNATWQSQSVQTGSGSVTLHYLGYT